MGSGRTGPRDCYSRSNPALLNFRVRLFSVTVRTTCSGAPSGMSASISSQRHAHVRPDEAGEMGNHLVGDTARGAAGAGRVEGHAAVKARERRRGRRIVVVLATVVVVATVVPIPAPVVATLALPATSPFGLVGVELAAGGVGLHQYARRVGV